jgi:hypothetical protein
MSELEIRERAINIAVNHLVGGDKDVTTLIVLAEHIYKYLTRAAPNGDCGGLSLNSPAR